MLGSEDTEFDMVNNDRLRNRRNIPRRLRERLVYAYLIKRASLVIGQELDV